MTDLISRADAIEAVTKLCVDGYIAKVDGYFIPLTDALINTLSALPSADCIEFDFNKYQPRVRNKVKDGIPSADAVQGWIPCSERLPENIRPVIVTWKNTDPASYYQYIVGKHYIGTAHYYRGKWYWYSSVTEDLLAEYGKCDSEEFDEAIEVVAWMPLPKPYKGGDDE